MFFKKCQRFFAGLGYRGHSFWVAFGVCGLAALYYGYEDTLRVLPGTMGRYMAHDLQLTAAQLGFMASLFYVGYAPMQIPAGLLLDRFGPKRCLGTAALLAACAAVVFAVTPYYTAISLSRFAMGVSSSVAYLSALLLASRWFERRYFVVIAGLVQLVGCVGSLLGQAPLAWMLTQMSWRHATLWVAMICLILGLLFWMFIQDRPVDSATSKQDTSAVSWPALWRGLCAILKQRQTWAAGGFAFLVWAPIAVFAVLWGIPFFHDAYHLSETQGGVLLTAIWVGVSIGGPFFGWLSNWMGRRCIPMMIGGLIGVLAAYAIVYGMHRTPVLCVLLFLFGFASSSQAVSFGVVFDRQPAHLLGAATGFNNMSVVMGGFLFQPVVGWLLTHHAAGGHTGPMPVYHLADYQYALWLLPVCYLLSAMVAVFGVQETYCEPTAHKKSMS